MTTISERLPNGDYRYAGFFEKKEHHPSGLMSPATSWHDFGGRKNRQSEHFAPLLG